jgi:hypothetical protein
MKLIIGFGATVLMIGVAIATPDLPVPRHDTLQDYENVCNETNGFTTFSMQVSCVKALVNEESRGFVSPRDLDTQLYLLTADKLADDVNNNRTTVAAARVSLQRALIEVESKHQAEAQALRVQAEADRREKQAASQQRAINDLANDSSGQRHLQQVQTAQAPDQAAERTDRVHAIQQALQNASAQLQANDAQRRAKYCAQWLNNRTSNTKVHCNTYGNSTNCSGETTQAPLPVYCQ